MELVKNDILILRSQSNGNGKLPGEFTETGSYIEGLKHGPWITTDKNGNSITRVYRQGKIV